MSDSQPNPLPSLIAPEAARYWQEERMRVQTELNETQAKVAPLRSRLTQIDALLRAAAPFAADIQEFLDVIDEQAMGAEGVALTEAIKKALAAQKGNAIIREAIKILLPQHGYPAQKLQTNPNYFYTALKRLVARKEIEEEPAGQFRIKQN